MIAITSEAGLSLKLDVNQRLTLDRQAGWLQDDVLPGSKSYPIEFPIKPNEAFLKSGYRPDSARPLMEFPVTVRLSGVLYRRCLLNYKIVEGKGTGYLKIDSGEVFSQLKKRTLQEILTDEVVLSSSFLDPLQLKLTKIAALAPGEFPLTFFPIRNEGFFESTLNSEKLSGFVRQPYINAWGKLPSGQWGFLMDSPGVAGYPISPQFYLVWILKRIFAWAGYKVTGDWIADPEVQRLVILNQTAISSKQPGLTATTVVSSAVAGQHLPKMNVGEFLKAIRQGFGLLYDFDGNLQTVTIRSFSSILRSPARDLSAYLAGKYGIDPQASKGFSVKESIDGNDELYKDAQGNLIPTIAQTIGTLGTDRTEINLPLCGTQMVYEPSPMGGNWTLCALRQAGNMLDFYYKDTDRYPAQPAAGQTDLQLKNDIGLRIVSYRGLVESSNGSLYPLGTTDVRNGKQQIISQKAARLGGRSGLWNSGLRQFFYFRDQTRPVTVPLDLPVALAASLRFHEPISLKLDGPALRTYLIDRLQAESPGPSGKMQAKLFAFSLPDGLELSQLASLPLVYVEMIVVATLVSDPPAPAFPTRHIENKITLRCWADPAKTTPVVPSGLSVTIRLRKVYETGYPALYVPTSAFVDELRSYTLNAVETVVETSLVSMRYSINSDDKRINDWHTGTLLLDPGDDYLIAS